MKKVFLVAVASACVAWMGIPSAYASLVININESGGNVEASYSGSVGIPFPVVPTNSGFDGYHPSTGAISFGSGPVDWFEFLFDPVLRPNREDSLDSWTAFGSGGFGNWDTSSGDALALYSDPTLGLPAGYISGDMISGSAAKFGASLSSLGMTPGSYVTNFKIGDAAGAPGVDIHTITVNIIPQVPVPAAVWLFGSGLLGIIGIAKRKKS